MSDDSGIELHPVTGKIVKSKLSSERAKELANIRWEKTKSGSVQEILQELGYDSPEDAPATTRELAEKATSSKGGNVSALMQLIKMKGAFEASEAQRGKVKPGETCPLCNSTPDARAIADALGKPKKIAKLLDLLGELDE